MVMLSRVQRTTSRNVASNVRFVGAFSAWAFQTGNLFGLTTPGLDRVGAGFGFIGATLGLLHWPLIGAAVCAGAAFFSLGRRLAN